MDNENEDVASRLDREKAEAESTKQAEMRARVDRYLDHNYHTGYKRGLYDAYLFAFMLVMATVTVYCWMQKEGQR